MRPRLRRWIVFWSAAGLLLIGIIGRFFIWQSVIVPDHFMQARQRSVNIAQTIVRFSNDALLDLQEIALAERSLDLVKALGLVTKALEKNQQARGEAINLSATLDVMAKSLSSISPRQARDLATEGLGYEVTMINHLITYNDYLNQLFKLLESKFTDREAISDSQIKDWINLINGQAEAISVLNKKFNEVMQSFDKIVTKG